MLKHLTSPPPGLYQIRKNDNSRITLAPIWTPDPSPTSTPEHAHGTSDEHAILCTTNTQPNKPEWPTRPCSVYSSTDPIGTDGYDQKPEIMTTIYNLPLRRYRETYLWQEATEQIDADILVPPHFLEQEHLSRHTNNLKDQTGTHNLARAQQTKPHSPKNQQWTLAWRRNQTNRKMERKQARI